MTIKQIEKRQKLYGLTEMQQMISSGDAWKMEGAYGRLAMHCLSIGACFLPDEVHFDYYGNRVPSRYELKPGTKGTLQLAQEFWSGDTVDEYLGRE